VDATGDFVCLVFVLLAASARPQVVQLPGKYRKLPKSTEISRKLLSTKLMTTTVVKARLRSYILSKSSYSYKVLLLLHTIWSQLVDYYQHKINKTYFSFSLTLCIYLFV